MASMAIESLTFGLSSVAQKFQHCDDRFRLIVLNIHLYLFNASNSRVYSILRRGHLLKCNKSWDLINEALDRFIKNPRDNYSSLKAILEQEQQKFPSHSYYCKQLRALSDYIAMGPSLKCS
jgi:hypothetical protein